MKKLKQLNNSRLPTIPQHESSGDEDEYSTAPAVSRPSARATPSADVMSMPDVAIKDFEPYNNSSDVDNSHRAPLRGRHYDTQRVTARSDLSTHYPPFTGFQETERQIPELNIQVNTSSEYSSNNVSDVSPNATRFVPSPRIHRVWGNSPKQSAPSANTPGHSRFQLAIGMLPPTFDATMAPPSITASMLHPQARPSSAAFRRPRTAPPVSDTGNATNRDTLIFEDRPYLPPPSDSTLRPAGKWRCCKCHVGHRIYITNDAEHPISTLTCSCIHHSCADCWLESTAVKRFEPIAEHEVICLALEDDHHPIRFGVFCDGCGLSWRASEVGEKKKTALQKIAAMPKSLVKKGLRHSRSLSNISAGVAGVAGVGVVGAAPAKEVPVSSKSTFNLRQLSSEMEKGHGKQADVTTVKFVGIRCTCGLVTAADSLCFQLVSSEPVTEEEKKKKKKKEEEEEPEALQEMKRADREKGHDQPLLALMGGRIRHPNPLRSNPV